MFSEPAVFVDIETNGGNGPSGRIIEVGLIRVEDGEVVREYKSLVNPGTGVPVWIEQLTGIRNSDLVGAPYFEDIAQELREILDGAIFVAHNVRFDYSFFRSHFAALGHDYKPKLFCTVRMSRGMYPEHKGHSLEKIINRHGIAVEDRHRAYDDARAIYEFAKLAIVEKGHEAFLANAALQMKTKTLPPNLDESKFAHLPTAPGIYIFEAEDGAPLYVGKSVNIRARVMSHFASDTKVAKEMKISQRSFNISYEQTDTEVEALLLESAKVKELQPIFNHQLRRKATQSVLLKKYDDHGYLTIAIENRELSDATDLDKIYSVYTTRAQARASLESLTRTYQLCPKLMELEKTKSYCFRYQLGLCKGACGGEELPFNYNERAEFALGRSKIEAWPFQTKIAVKISDLKSLIIDQWVIEGIMHHEFEPMLERLTNGFDVDTYKILRSYLRKNPGNITSYSE